MGIPVGGQALAQPVGAAADTSYRGRYAVAFTYGWVTVAVSVRPTVRFAAVVSLDLPCPSLPWQRIDQMLDFLTAVVERVPAMAWDHG